jgi:hypothetical protein
VTSKFIWTNQEFSLALISIRLLGVGWFRASCYDPLMLNLSIPFGAIVFLIKNHKNLNLLDRNVKTSKKD